MITPRRLIVTHHSPDLDAVGAVWLLKRFDSQHYANAKVAFVNPGEEITYEAAQEVGFQMHEIMHVDTGLGEFDHHQADRGLQHLSASLLVLNHVIKIHPDLEKDETLKTLVDHITDSDHFGEVHWPEAEHYRYCFMIESLIRGMEFTDPHNDDSQLHFGLQCLDNAYASLEQHLKATEILAKASQGFVIKAGTCLALESRNDETVKLAQKQGYSMVIRRNPEDGSLRIKARPDADLMLKALADELTKLDPKASWYYHPSGKMLLNGSSKHRNQKPTILTLDRVVELVKRLYA